MTRVKYIFTSVGGSREWESGGIPARVKGYFTLIALVRGLVIQLKNLNPGRIECNLQFLIGSRIKNSKTTCNLLKFQNLRSKDYKAYKEGG